MTRATRKGSSWRRAMAHHRYSSSSGTVSSWAAIWNTESAEVYTIGFPVRWCSSPSSWMITVPLAARFARMPGTPVSRTKGSTTSGGKPRGKSASPSFRTIPIISQWPVIVSLPFDRSAIRPCQPTGYGSGGTPEIAVRCPRPIRPITGRVRPPTARLVLPMVSEPTSPYSAASGRAPQPALSATRMRNRLRSMPSPLSGGTSRRRSRRRRTPRSGSPRRGASRARRPRCGSRRTPSRPPRRPPPRGGARRPRRSRPRPRSRSRSSRRRRRRRARRRRRRPSRRGRGGRSRGSPSPAPPRRGSRRGGRRRPRPSGRRGRGEAGRRGRARRRRAGPPRAPPRGAPRRPPRRGGSRPPPRSGRWTRRGAAAPRGRTRRARRPRRSRARAPPRRGAPPPPRSPRARGACGRGRARGRAASARWTRGSGRARSEHRRERERHRDVDGFAVEAREDHPARGVGEAEAEVGPVHLLLREVGAGDRAARLDGHDEGGPARELQGRVHAQRARDAGVERAAVRGDDLLRRLGIERALRVRGAALLLVRGGGEHRDVLLLPEEVEELGVAERDARALRLLHRLARRRRPRRGRATRRLGERLVGRPPGEAGDVRDRRRAALLPGARASRGRVELRPRRDPDRDPARGGEEHDRPRRDRDAAQPLRAPDGEQDVLVLLDLLRLLLEPAEPVLELLGEAGDGGGGGRLEVVLRGALLPGPLRDLHRERVVALAAPRAEDAAVDEVVRHEVRAAAPCAGDVHAGASYRPAPPGCQPCAPSPARIRARANAGHFAVPASRGRAHCGAAPSRRSRRPDRTPPWRAGEGAVLLRRRPSRNRRRTVERARKRRRRRTPGRASGTRHTAPEPDCDRHGGASAGATEEERVRRVPLSRRVHAGSVDRSGPTAATAACSSETPPQPLVAATEVAAANSDHRGASAPCRPWFGRSPIGGAPGPGLGRRLR